MNLRLLIELSLRNVRRYARKSLGAVVIMAVAALTLNVLAGYVAGNLEVVRNAFVRWGARGHLVIEKPLSALARSTEGAGQELIGERERKLIERLLQDDPAVAVYGRT